MNNKEAEHVRCSIARYVGCPPDSIAITTFSEESRILYSVDYHGYNMLIGFDGLPTPQEIVEEVDEMYLVILSLKSIW